eukprot:6175531-Pleurochrysis_carterae.AAC.2
MVRCTKGMLVSKEHGLCLVSSNRSRIVHTLAYSRADDGGKVTVSRRPPQLARGVGVHARGVASLISGA